MSDEGLKPLVMDGTPYVELRRASEFSLLTAYGRMSDHVKHNLAIGMKALCITDHGTMRGAYQLQRQSYVHTPAGVEQPHSIYGAVLNLVDDHTQMGLPQDVLDEVTFGLEGRDKQKAVREAEAKHQVNKTRDVTVRAMTHEGYTNLSRLTSISWNAGCYRGVPRVDIDLLCEHHEGLSVSFGGINSLLGDLITQNRLKKALALCKRLKAVFGKRFMLEIQPHPGLLHEKINKAFYQISSAMKVPVIAVNDSHYVKADDQSVHEAVLCMSAKTILKDPDRPRSPDGYHVRTGDEMLEAFEENHPDLDQGWVLKAVRRTVKVAAQHTYVMELDRFRNLVPEVPHDSEDDVAELRRLCKEGWEWRKIEERPAITGIPIEEYHKRLEHEFNPDGVVKFPRYFLIVRDLINWSRAQGIMTGPGRGSAAGSLVCYLLGITSLDPLEHGLLFERFLSPSRIDMPDIDMDFEDKRREEVIEYIHDKYGHENVALIATVGYLKGKSALKDAGRVLDVPHYETNNVTGAIVERSSGDERASQTVEDSFKEFEVCRKYNAKHPDVLPLAMRLEGHAKQLGVHAAGVIPSPVPLPEVIPVETHYRNGEITKMVAFDMYGAADMGLLKLDVLGLRTLTVLNDARKQVLKRHGVDIDFETLPLDDKATLGKFTDHEYVGVFQFDSTGAHAACDGITFTAFEDIAAMVALNRPGPARSGLATEFKKRKIDPSHIKSVHPLYDEICSDTLGVLVYQEHVTKIFTQMAGYEPGTADSLRKVIAKKIGDDVLRKEREKFVAGCIERGVEQELAEKIISDITFFGSYGFNKSHSAAYGIISYWQMWLKAHYPSELMWALMDNEPKREQIARYATECRRLGIEVRPPDINHSGGGFAINEDGDIVASLIDIKGVGASAVESIEANQPFEDMYDLLNRVNRRAVHSGVIKSLIKAGALRTLLPNTKEALETIDEKGSWMDIAKKRKKGWHEDLLASIEAMNDEEDYDAEDLLHLAGEVSPLGGGKHPMEVYRSLMEGELSDVPFVDLDDPKFWNKRGPIIAGVMIDIKYNQVGDFETVEPSEEQKRKMGWGQRYANINIEDASGEQIRVKVHQDNFNEFRHIVDQGVGTCMAVRLQTYKGVKAARATYMVDLEVMRQKARHDLAFTSWERCLTLDHPAGKHAPPRHPQGLREATKRHKTYATVLIIHRKNIITRNGDRMCFLAVEFPDHRVAEVTVFPDEYSDFKAKMKVGTVVTLQLRKDKSRKSFILADEGIMKVHETITTEQL